MAKWKEIHASDAKEFFFGGTSKMDQVFLSHQSPQDMTHTDYSIDVCHDPLKHSLQTSPKSLDILETFNCEVKSKSMNCYQVTLCSCVIIALICVLVFVFRDYIKDLLVRIENVDSTISFFIFVLLFTLVSFPVAWGILLLMIACGYLFGLIYGPIVIEVCSMIGVATAHVTMKKFCRCIIIKKFYNDNMTAVISVVDGAHGFKVVALTRLTPLPFGLQNSLFSLTNIPLHLYIAATSLGIIPSAILNSYIGTTLRSMNDILTDKTNQTTGWIVLSVQILFTIALTCFVVRKARVELKKAVETTEDSAITKTIPECVVHENKANFKETAKSNGCIKMNGNHGNHIFHM